MFRPRARLPQRRRPDPFLLCLETLEDRTLLSTLPEAVVTNQRSIGNGYNTQTVMDPVNASKLVTVSDGATLFSTDGGANWTALTITPNIADPNTGAAYPVASNFSAAIDRNENLYVTYIERDVTNASGSLVLQKYSFTTGTPTRTDMRVFGALIASAGTGYNVGDLLTVSGGAGTAATLRVTNVTTLAPLGVIRGITVVNPGSYTALPTNAVSVTGGSGSGARFNLSFATNVLERWMNTDPVLNPVVAVDNNLPTFTDPTTGTTQTDTMSGKAVYVAWNTNNVQPVTNPATFVNPAVIKVSASADAGLNFTSPQFVAAGQNLTGGSLPVPRYSAPKIVFTQGSADGRVAGGQLVFVWDSFGGGNTISYDASQPDGGNLATPAAGSASFQGGTGVIVDASVKVNTTTATVATTPANSTIYAIGDVLTVQDGANGLPESLPSLAANRTTLRVTEVGLTAVSVSNGGTGYGVGDVLNVAGGTSSATAQVNVTAVAGGVITGVSIAAAGSYSVKPATPNTAGGGTGTGATLNLTFNAVTKVVVVNQGVYIVPPTNPVTTTGGTGPTNAATFNLTYSVVAPPTVPSFSDQVKVNTFTDTVSITDPTFIVKDFDVALSLVHPHLDQLSIDLIAPDNTTIHLIHNRTDNFGRTVDISGNPIPPSVNPPGGLVNQANLGTSSAGVQGGTIFDNEAARLITDTGAVAPYIAHFRPEGGGGGALSDFYGLSGTSASISGTWTLRITDNKNDGETVQSAIPVAYLQNWTLHFTSYISTSGFGTDRTVPTVVTPAGGALTAPYPSGNSADPTANGGIAPGISVAIDNTLGSFSPYQGRFYVSYTDGLDVYLVAGDSLTPGAGATWRTGVMVNDDSTSDNFSEGTRFQYMPTVAVDQVTGTVGYMYYDARWDPAKIRSTTSFSTSIDGGKTFSPSVFLNTPKTATDAITGDVITIEPIPGNMPQSGVAFGFGDRQGLVMNAGHVVPVFGSNQNSGPVVSIGSGGAGYAVGNVLTLQGGTFTSQAQVRVDSVSLTGAITAITLTASGLYTILPPGTVGVTGGSGTGATINISFTQLLTATMTIAAGPRIIYGDMGPIIDVAPLNGYNNTFTSDGTRKFSAFEVQFDRPIDPTTFTGDDVTVKYRDPFTAASLPANLTVTGAANFTITALDTGSFNSSLPSTNAKFAPGINAGNPLASTFLIRLNTPLSGVGTYSYSVGPDIHDDIRDPSSGGAGSSLNQYASSVFAFSSEFGGGWFATDALGPPNVASYGDDSNAWAALNSDGPPNPEFLDLRYTTPVHATGVVVRETLNSGFVSKIELVDTNNVYHTVFSGVDPSPVGSIANFTVTFPATNYLVKGVKVSVDPTHVLGAWEEIDSVQLQGSTAVNVLWIDNQPFTSGWVTSGFNVTHVTLAQFNAIADLSPYQDLYFSTADAVLTPPSPAAATLVTNFVQNGGGLFLEASFGSNISWAPLGGTITTSSTNSGSGDSVVLTAAGLTHQVTAGQTNASLSTWGTSQHGTFTAFPASLTNLASASGGADPGILAGSFGSGRLVYSMIDAGYHQQNGANIPAAQLLIQNALDWAAVATGGAGGGNANSGNRMDQNQDAITNQASVDAFAIPRPVSGNIQSRATSNHPDALSDVPRAANGTPFLLPYDPSTQPLIIPGPYVVSTSVPGNPASTDNLVLNNTNNAIDVRFDRDIVASTFTPAALQQIIGPAGAIPLPAGSVTVTALDPGTGLPNPALVTARSFRVTFPPQALSGTYRMVFSPLMKDVNGNSVDTDQNAGLDVLKGFSATGGTVTVEYDASAIPVTIGPGAIVQATLSVADAYLIQQSASQHIQLRLKITHQNIPDLEAQLIAPDGTTIQLFRNAGTFGGTPHANMNDTLLDDFATVPISSAGTPIGTGPFNPQLPLTGLNGHGSFGTWTLQITNHGALSGTLDRWSLFLPKATPSSGLGEPIADQFSPHFRIFTQDPANALTNNAWTAIGPAAENVDENSGRIGGLAFDPSDPSGNTVFVAGASGGVWKTTNFLTNDANGPTYTPLTDLGPGFSLNVGSIAVFPRSNDPNQTIVFVATGEGDVGSSGVGFLRSMNGGKTWQVLDSLNNVDPANPADPSDPDKIAKMSSGVRNHQFVGSTAFKVIVDPTALPNGQVVVYAALNTGVWRSLDTGKTWTQVRAGNATDVVLAAGSTNSGGNRDKLYAAFRGDGVYFTPSALSANSMTQMLGGQGMVLRRDTDVTPDVPIPVTNPASTPNGGFGRIVLAAPALTDSPLENTLYQGWLYALVITTGNQLQGLYMTKDFGGNWTKVKIPAFIPPAPAIAAIPTNNESLADYDPFARPASGFAGQGNYDVSMAIDPNNPNIVYIGGTTDGPPIGFIRVDSTTVSDPYALVAYDNSDNDGGTVQYNSTGPASIKPNNAGPPAPHTGPGLPYGILDSSIAVPPTNAASDTAQSPYLNLLRDPNDPFNTPSSFHYHNVARFNNGGDDARWMPFTAPLEGTTDQHELLAFKDPATGFTRLIFGDDQGVFTGLDKGDGTLVGSIGTRQLPQGSRNGNLQIIQFYFGAAQPSTLAADIAGAMFYGNAQDDGSPISTPDILHTGDISWHGPEGDAAGIATDQTGSGTYYTYRWPCCGGSNPLPTDFFMVQDPSVGQLVSRVGGPGASIIQPGDDPKTGAGQWPFLGGANFAVNPIDKNGLLISGLQARVGGNAGTIYRSTDMGKDWFIIGNTAQGDLDGTYAPALAFGSPSSALPGNNNDFIYAGTNGGRIFVTFNGGGVGQWKNISTGLTGTPAVIVPNPTHDSHEVYAVTSTGVFWMADSSVAAPTWVKLNDTAGQGALFGLATPIFGNTSDTFATLRSLKALAVDWRWAIPDHSGAILDASNANPIVITTTTNHGLATGDQVIISGVAGNTAANGTFTVTVVTPTTFRLNGAVGNGAYVAGTGTWASVARHPVLYVAGEGGVFRSTDKGVTWTQYAGGTNEQQTIAIPSTVSSLTFNFYNNGVTTPATPLAFSTTTTAAQVQANLQTIPALAALGNVTVTGPAGGPFVVTFGNQFALTDVQPITVSAVVGAGNITVTETTRGVPAGGYMPSADVRDLDLVLGNINPTTGFPDESFGLDMLVAFTYGRGAFAIRMDNSAIKQYAITPRLGPRVTDASQGGNAIDVTFSSSVDSASFKPNDVTLNEQQTVAVAPTVTTLTLSYNSVAATSALAYSAATTAAQVQAHLETIPALITNEQQILSIPSSVTTVAFSFNDKQGSVVTATNAGPIVITSNINHGLATGDVVTITGAVGNTAANGTFTVTVLSPNTFSLNGSSGNGVYGGGGVWFRSGAALNFSPVTTAAQILANLNTIPGLNGNIAVSGPIGGPYVITFINALKGQDVPLLTALNAAVIVTESTKGGPNIRVAGPNGGPFVVTFLHSLAGQDTGPLSATFTGVGPITITQTIQGGAVGLLNPAGTPINASSVTELSGGFPNPHNFFAINLPTPPNPPAPGFYQFVLGPALSDYSGNRMDQNQNGTGGEVSDDMYSGRVLFQGFTNNRPALGTNILAPNPNPALPSINEDDVTNAGVDLATWVAGLPAGALADADDPRYAPGQAPRGIAVTSVDNTNGQWQYAVDVFDGKPVWINFGVPTAATARLLEVSPATRVRFVPNANFNSGFVNNSVQFTFKAWDMTAGTAGNTLDTTPAGSSTSSYSTATATAVLTVIAVNDAPVNTVPGAQTTVEDTARVFSTANGNRISVADVDDLDNSIVGDQQVQVTLSAPNTILTLNGTTGLTGAGTGTAVGTITFSGSLNDVNTALNGLSVLPSANFVGSTTLTVTTNDLGNTGIVGPLSDVDTVAITVTPVNDAPVNVVPAAQTSPEDTNLVFSTANLNLIAASDVDDADNAITGDEVVQVSLTAVNGTLTLTATAGLSFTFTDANGTGAGDGTADVTMTFRGTLTNVNTALDGLKFLPNSNYVGAASVTMVTNDLGNFGAGVPLTDTDVVPITITPVNDAPVNTVPGLQTTAEELALIFSAGNSNQISVADIDDGDDAILGNEPVQVTLTAASGVLTLSGVTGLSFSFTDANGTGAGDGTADATMTFRGTLTDVNNALNGLSYLPNLNFNGAAGVTIVTNDLGNFGTGGALTDTDTAAITVTPVNDAPVNTVPGAQTTAEDTPVVFSAAKLIKVADVDDADNAIPGDEIVQVTLAAVNGTLTLSATTGLSFTFTDVNGAGTGDGIADGVMTFRGSITDVNAALNGLSFTPTLNFNGAASLTITTKDLGNFGTGGNLTDVDSVNITVTPVNDAPVNVAPAAQTTLEDTPLVFSTANANQISTSDVDDADNGIPGDEPVQVTLTATNGVLTLSGTTGLSFSFTDANGIGAGDGAADATMTFRGTLSDVNAALNGLSFASPLNFNGSASVTIVTNDLGNTGAGTALTDSDTVAVTVTPVNDLPVNTTPIGSTTPEETPLTFSTANSNAISVSDVDDADNHITGDEPVQITLAAADGTLTLNGITGLGFTVGDGVADSTMTFTGTLDDVNAALNGLVFTPNLNFTNVTTVVLTTFDQNNFGVGGSSPVVTPISINVTPVNDAPVNSVPGAQTAIEDTNLVFSTGNGNRISVSDVDDVADGVPGNIPVQVTLTATHGVLSLSGTLGLSFSFSDINGTGAGDGTADATMTFRGTLTSVNAALGTLRFLANQDYVGPASVTIVTNDLGNIGTGGPLSDTDSVGINVTPVNDAPVNTTPAVQTTPEETALVFSTLAGNRIAVGDVDDADNSVFGDEMVQVQLTATNGVMNLNGTTGLFFTFTDANGTGAGDGTADATMTFRGTLDAVNIALDGMTYTPDLNFVGAATIAIVTNDLGNFGTGGPLTDADTVAVTVTPVNDAPVNTVPAAQTIPEDTNLVFSSGNANPISVADVDDVDNGALGDEIVQVTLSATNGALTLSSLTGLSFSFSDAFGTGTGDGTADAVMTFRGSLSNINSALNGLIFRATLNYVGAAGVTITTNDLGNFGTGGPLSDTDSVNITVTPVNDAPVNTVPAAQNTPEETALLFNTANGNRISVGDVDDADNGAPGDEPIQVSLTALNGVMTLGTTAGLSFSFSDANGTGAGDGTADATMTFRGTLNAVNQALNGMSFLSPLNFVGAGKVTIATNDLGNFGTGGPLSDTDSVNITVTPVNDAPVNTVPAAQSAIEDMPVTLSTANADVISVSDVDDGDNAVAGDETVQVTLTGLGGVVTLNSVLGLSFAFADANGTGAGDGTGDAIMTFRGTLSNVNAALDGLRFDPTPNFVGVANVAITTNDLGNFGAGGPKTDTDSVAITYSAVNDAPQNTLPAAQDKLEDVPLVFSSASGNAITIGDVDDADNGIPGDEIVQVSLNAANGDLTLSNTTGLDFGFVDANGTGAGDGTADTTMTFRGTLSDINAALNGLLFHSPQDYFGPASVSVSTNDLGNFGAGVPLSDADTLDITVEPVNDAPTFNVPANPPTIGQGAGAQSVANFTTGMSTGPSNESSQSLVAFNVTQLSSTGSIAFLAPPSIDPVTGTLTYQPTATAFGTATFSVTLTDNGPGAPPPNVNTSAVQTFTLTILLPSFVGLTPTPTNPLHGQTSSLAIAVIGSPGGPPTGTVTINDTFNSTTTILQSNVPLVAGGVNFDLGILATGTHSLQVFYSGDNVFAPSNKIITYVVGPAATSTALSSSTADPTIFGNAVVFTAVVSVTSGGTPGTISGTVEFREGVTLLGTATAPSSTTATTATYLFSYSNLTANGSVGHTVTAVFRGSNPSSSSTEDFGASPTSNGVVRHVLAANTTTVDLVAAPASPSNFGQPVTFTAKVTASNSPAIPDNGSVVFRNGTVILGTGLVDSTGHATITTLPTALAVGTRSITATYVGGVNFNASVQSPPLLQVVRATTSTTLTSNRLYWAVNQPVTFTATVKTTVSGAPAIPPGGTVTFIIDGVSQSPTHLNTSGKFQKVVTFATPGLHLVSAIFNPPNQYFTTSTAPELKQDNVRKATVLSLASSLPTSVIGQTVRFGAKIVGAGGIPIAPNTETISFFDNGVLLATVFLNTSGVAYFSTSSLTLGTHVITATYSGDANFNPAIRKLSQIVTKTGGRLV